MQRTATFVCTLFFRNSRLLCCDLQLDKTCWVSRGRIWLNVSLVVRNKLLYLLQCLLGISLPVTTCWLSHWLSSSTDRWTIQRYEIPLADIYILFITDLTLIRRLQITGNHYIASFHYQTPSSLVVKSHHFLMIKSCEMIDGWVTARLTSFQLQLYTVIRATVLENNVSRSDMVYYIMSESHQSQQTLVEQGNEDHQ